MVVVSEPRSISPSVHPGSPLWELLVVFNYEHCQTEHPTMQALYTALCALCFPSVSLKQLVWLIRNSLRLNLNKIYSFLADSTETVSITVSDTDLPRI